MADRKRKPRKLSKTKPLSSGQVANLLGVGPTTLRTYWRQKILVGFTLPNRNGKFPHRRYPVATVVAFMKSRNIPIPDELKDTE